MLIGLGARRVSEYPGLNDPEDPCRFELSIIRLLTYCASPALTPDTHIYVDDAARDRLHLDIVLYVRLCQSHWDIEYLYH